jgi:hypothetical protein
MPEQQIEEGLLDERGCLSAEGFRVLREFPPGAVPDIVARHLARCVGCQRRALETELGPRPLGRRPPRELLPSLGRTALLGVVVVAALMLFLWSVQKMMGK